MKFMTISPDGPQGGNIHEAGINAYPIDSNDLNGRYTLEYSADEILYPYIEPYFLGEIEGGLAINTELSAQDIINNLNNINKAWYISIGLQWDLWCGYKKTGMEHGANGPDGLPLNYPTNVYPPDYPPYSGLSNPKTWMVFATKYGYTTNAQGLVWRFAGTNETADWGFDTTQAAMGDTIRDVCPGGYENDSAIYNKAFVQLHPDMPYGMLVDGRDATSAGTYEKDDNRYSWFTPVRDVHGTGATGTFQITFLYNSAYESTQYFMCGTNSNIHCHFRISSAGHISLMNASNATTVWPRYDTTVNLYVDNPYVLNNLYNMNVNSNTSWYASKGNDFSIEDVKKYKLVIVTYHCLGSNSAQTYQQVMDSGYLYCVNGQIGKFSQTQTITSFTRIGTGAKTKRSCLENSDGYYTILGGRNNTGTSNYSVYPPVAGIVLDIKSFNRKLTMEEMKKSQIATFQQLNLGVLFKNSFIRYPWDGPN